MHAGLSGAHCYPRARCSYNLIQAWSFQDAKMWVRECHDASQIIEVRSGNFVDRGRSSLISNICKWWGDAPVRECWNCSCT